MPDLQVHRAPLRVHRRGEAFAAWRRFFEALAERRPLVLVFEDVQWADDGSLDFVDHLVDWSSGVPLLVVCTARPELLERRPGWGGGKRNAATVSLDPLSDDETAVLFARLLDRAVLPAETQQALLLRAGGNPLYAEQYARMLDERADAESLPLPETVQGIIAARIDGLSPAEKALLQDAAVIGKVFWIGAIARGAPPGKSRNGCTRSSARTSSSGRGVRRSTARPSTPSGTSSSATSRTARSPVRDVLTCTAERLSGSNPSP